MKNFFLVVFVLIVGYIIGYKTKYTTKNFLNYTFRLILKKDNLSEKKIPISIKYKEVNCPSSSFQIAYFGQSNSGNSVKTKSKINLPNNLFQYDWQSRKCYQYKEPLIGTTGNGGNLITYTALKLALETSEPIIIIPFGKGGSSVFEWAYGHLSFHHNLVLENIKNYDLDPQLFLWHQGESDHGVSKKKYKDALQVVLDRTREHFPNSKFGVALATRCKNNEWQPVRDAQQEITKLNKNTFISADSDKVYNKKFRYDFCHFSNLGAQKLGNIYYESIKNFIDY